MNRIAIVGMSCRLPGASSPDELWQMLVAGKNAVGTVPASRWSTDEFYDRDPQAAGAMYTTQGGFLENIDLFDPACFGIAPREALHMDPQQRLMLELAWEAFEDAGIPHQKLAGSPTGVFIGFGPMEYALTQLQNPELIDAYTNTGYFPSIISNRISYVFDLRGPSLSLDTACSASLVAVKLACDSLRRGETNLALAGGVNLMVDPTTTVAFCKLSALSPIGRCKTFDAAADGYVRGEGAGIVLLKRFEDAVRDGDRIYASIIGEAITQDGRSNGLTAPNRLAQEEVLQQAYRSAGIEPNTVQYVEAHGTGTFLGDPIEISALGNVLGRGRDQSHALRVGSLKTNIGHLESAAGISGLIKLAKCIENRTLVPHLHFENPNPHIDFAKHRIEVVTKQQPWPEHHGPLVAGISAFGFGGTNAHLVLSDGAVESKTLVKFADTESPQLMVLSARDPNALEEMKQQYQRILQVPPQDASFSEVCRATATTRNQLEYRTSIVATSGKQAAQMLARPVSSPACKARSRPRIGYLFTGQGAQYNGMAQELWNSEAVFRSVIDQCDSLMIGLRKEKLSPILFDSSHGGRINETEWTQPAVFALQWGLFELWKTWGIQPDIVLGHSIGEIAGACAAGMMPWQDGFAFAATRGSLMQSLGEPGGMIAILDSQAKVESLLADHSLDLELAVSNSPTNWVLSGKVGEIDRALEVTKQLRILSAKLNVSHAFHSTLMDPILTELCHHASAIRWSPSTVPFVANLTGEVLPVGTTLSPEYFQAHARSEVRFSKSIESLTEYNLDTCLELGPSTTLTELAKSNWSEEGRPTVVFATSLKRGVNARQTTLEAAGKLFESGHSLRFEHLYTEPSRFVPLPKYPFQRERYWEFQPARRFSADRTKATSEVGPRRISLLGERLDSAVDIFQNQLSATCPAWIDDHRVGDRVVMPAAAYIDMAISAVAEGRRKIDDRLNAKQNPNQVISLEGIRFLSPLLFEESIERRVQCVTQDHAITILSRDDTKENWTKHCTARLATDASDEESLSLLRAECDESFWRQAQVLDAEVLYERLSEHGLQYGPAFRGIEKVFSTSDMAWAEIAMSAESSVDEFFISPMLLDSCFQAVACLVSSNVEPNGRTYIPATVERVTIMRRPTQKAYCRVLNVDTSGRKQLCADLHIFDEHKQPIAHIQKLRLIAANLSRSNAEQKPTNWIRNEQWVECEPVASGSVSSRSSFSGSIRLISTQDSMTLAPLQEALIDRGVNCACVSLNQRCNSSEREDQKTDYGLSKLTESTLVIAIDGDASASVERDEFSEAREQIRWLHSWLQRAAKEPGIERVVFLTVGGLTTGSPTQRISVASQAVVGWIRSIRFEFPKWRIEHLDFDANQDISDQHKNAADLIATSLACPELAHRDGRWYRRVLGDKVDPSSDRNEASVESSIHTPNSALVFEQKGSIDFLAIGQKQRLVPEADEVEIAIHSTGLNFRDVLNVLGMYPGDAGPLGGECSGIVTRVGSSVHNLRVGDRVAAILSGAFSDYSVSKAALTVPLPTSISLATGAGLPIAFATATLGINHFGKTKLGDRVLIHAGTGGVGLAAIHLALRTGAEVYATAGSERKRRHLLSLGVAKVWNSRDKNFASSIVDEIGARPFDLILNSLSGDFIPSSMALLKSGGRFIEIGKIGVWTHDAVAECYPDIAYHPFDLAELSKQNSIWIGQVLAEVIDDLSRDSITYPVMSVPFAKSRDAFRFMSQAKHIGKLVITQPQAPRSDMLFEGDATYVVTGAMGGIGKQLVPWMMQHGAKHLELWMHRSLSTSEQALVTSWTTGGVQIAVRVLDGSNIQELKQTIGNITDSGHRPAGIFHLAGVLHDSLVVNSTWDAYEKVLQAKSEYAWRLHQAVEGIDLDYFVLFSSMTALFGSPAQANYATANSFLDALAVSRRSTGKTAHSIQWGPWRGAGMAADFDRRAESMGIRLLDSHKALVSLERILRTESAVTAVIDIDSAKFESTLGRYIASEEANLDKVSASGKEVATTARGNSSELVAKWRNGLAESTNEKLPSAMASMVQSLVTKVLGLPDRTSLDPRQPLRELGLDSLMAVEMRNLLVEIVGVELDSTVLFDHPTIESLAHYLSQLSLECRSPQQDMIASSPMAAVGVEDGLSALSTQDLADQLAQELKLLSKESSQ